MTDQQIKEAILRFMAVGIRADPNKLTFTILKRNLIILFRSLTNIRSDNFENRLEKIFNDLDREQYIDKIEKDGDFYYHLDAIGWANQRLINDKFILDAIPNRKERFTILRNLCIAYLKDKDAYYINIGEDSFTNIIFEIFSYNTDYEYRLHEKDSYIILFNFFNNGGFLKPVSDEGYKFNKRGRKLIEIGNFDDFKNYEQEQKSKEIRREKLNDELIENNLLNGKINKKLLFVNYAIAGSTGAAAVFYSFEINKNYIHFHLPSDIHSLLIAILAGIVAGVLITVVVIELRK